MVKYKTQGCRKNIHSEYNNSLHMLKFFNWTQVKDLSLSCTKEKGNNQINVLATLISENQTGT